MEKMFTCKVVFGIVTSTLLLFSLALVLDYEQPGIWGHYFGIVPGRLTIDHDGYKEFAWANRIMLAIVVAGIVAVRMVLAVLETFILWGLWIVLIHMLSRGGGSNNKIPTLSVGPVTKPPAN